MTVSIRPAEPRDAARIAELHVEGWQEFRDFVPAADLIRAAYTHAPPGYDCPFCSMVHGDDNEPWSTQADVVHRDERTTAWVNGRWWRNNPGGAIIVPNAHVENLYGLDREQAGDIHDAARRIALAMRTTFTCEGTSTRQHNEPGGMQEVWHYHLHVFPRWVGDDLYGSDARLTTPEERAPYVAALRAALR